MEFRAVTPDDMTSYMNCVATAFHGPRPTQADIDARAALIHHRRGWAAFDGDTVVGTYVSFDVDITVPGPRPCRANAISGITTLPTHRRLGVLTRHITRDLAWAREQGHPLATLVAAEWPIYGRFGFGVAGWIADWSLDARTPWRDPAPEGSVRLVEAAEMLDIAPPVFDVHRSHSLGEISRDQLRWEIDLGIRPWPGTSGGPRHFAVGRDSRGNIDGYVTFSTTVDEHSAVLNATASIDELHATTSDGARRMWRFVADMDWVTKVTAERRSVADPLPHWLADGRGAQLTSRFDLPWIRPVHTAAALTARGYDRCDAIVIEVVDPMGLSGGRWLLDASPDGATCRPSRRRADVTMDVAALGSTIVGGEWLDPAIHRVDEHRPGALRRLAGLLRADDAFWCSTWF